MLPAAAGRSVRLSLQDSSITLTAQEHPDEAAGLEADTGNTLFDELVRRSLRPTIDPDGLAVLYGLPPGSYQVQLGGDSQQVVISPEATEVELRF